MYVQYFQYWSTMMTVSCDVLLCDVQAMQSEGKDINIKEVMDGWTLQMGYPVVTISKNESLDNMVTINQEHFIYDMEAKIRNPDLFNNRYNVQQMMTD